MCVDWIKLKHISPALAETQSLHPPIQVYNNLEGIHILLLERTPLPIDTQGTPTHVIEEPGHQSHPGLQVGLGP